MKYMDINKFDTANGTGIRVSLWVSGCSFACKGCHNSGAWSYQAGKDYTMDTAEEILKYADSEFIAGLSILGGEPLEPRNIEDVAATVAWFKGHHPKKDIWLWTGYKMHDLMERIADGDVNLEVALKNVDIIIDGKYDELLPTKKAYRGSDNQIMWKRKESFSIEFKMVD